MSDPFSHLEPSKLMEYRADLETHLLSQGHVPPLVENNMFWAYVAGRIHGTEPVEPARATKATWMILPRPGLMTPIALSSVHELLYPKGKPVYEKRN